MATAADDPTGDARLALWLAQRDARIRFRLALERSLAGDPDAVAILRGNFQALINFADQRRQDPEEEFPESEIVVNQNLW